MHWIMLAKVFAENEEHARKILNEEFHSNARKHGVDYYCILAVIKLEDPCVGHFANKVIGMLEEWEKKFKVYHEGSIRYNKNLIREKKEEIKREKDEEIREGLKKYLEELKENLELLEHYRWGWMAHYIELGEKIPKEDLTINTYIDCEGKLKKTWSHVFYFLVDYHS